MWGQIFCEIFKTKSHQWVASGQSQPFNIFINILRVQIHLSHGEKGLTFSIVNATYSYMTLVDTVFVSNYRK